MNEEEKQEIYALIERLKKAVDKEESLEARLYAYKIINSLK